LQRPFIVEIWDRNLDIQKRNEIVRLERASSALAKRCSRLLSRVGRPRNAFRQARELRYRLLIANVIVHPLAAQKY